MATKNAYVVGGLATFVNYDPKALKEGQVPILTPNSAIRLLDVGKEEGSYMAVMVDDESKKDMVFVEEIKPYTETAAAPVRTRIAKGVKPAVAPIAAKPAKAVKPPTKAVAPAPPVEKKTRTKKVKAAKVAKPKKVKAAKEPPKEIVIVDTAGVTAAITVNGDMLTAAENLVTQIEENYFTLGGVLAHIRKENIYLELVDNANQPVYAGNEGFRNYVEAELGTPYRKAMYLIDIYNHFSQLGIDEARLTTVGWTKARELARASTAENFEELLTFAQEHDKEQLAEHIRTMIVKAGDKAGRKVKPATAKKTEFKFRLFEDQGETAIAALDLAKAKTGSEDLNAAFVFILTEWISLQEGAEQVPLETAVAALNARYGVNLGEITVEEAEVAA